MNREDDRRVALRLAPVSHETLRRLDAYVALLGKWRKTINLLSESSFQEVWTRHIADCAQLLALAPEARVWVDMGAGAGFPGLVIAMQLAEQPGAHVHLIESDQRKCAFLREAARETGAPAVIHNARIEDAAPQIADIVDAVTARALAPLPRLVAFAKIWLDNQAVGVFPQGKASKFDRSDLGNFDIEFSKSRTDPASHIALIRPRSGAAAADAAEP